MPDTEMWFITERARALAVVLLTRRPDLVVHEAEDGSGLNLVVEIAKNRRSRMRRFGVLLRGALSPVDEEGANKVLRPAFQGLQRLEPPSFPACLFLFTMEDDQGYYTWLTEPLVAAGSRPVLRVHDSADCKRLTNASLDQIVQAVNKWYDALIESAPAES